MPLWLSCLLAVCTVLATAGCVYLAFSTAPAALKRQVNVLRAEVQEMQVTVEAIGQRWTAFKVEMEGLTEAVEDMLESVERKRRRVAAQESREKRKNGEEVPQTPEEYRSMLRRQARGAGFDV